MESNTTRYTRAAIGLLTLSTVASAVMLTAIYKKLSRIAPASLPDEATKPRALYFGKTRTRDTLGYGY